MQHWFQSQRLKLRRIKQKCQPRFTPNSTKRNLLSFHFSFLFFFSTMRHFPSGSHSFFHRTVSCQVIQAGDVPHHKARSGLDESLNYLMATVGAFRRCHLLSRGETGWLTGCYACSMGTGRSHSRRLFNKITGGILCKLTCISAHGCDNNRGYININRDMTLNPPREWSILQACVSYISHLKHCEPRVLNVPWVLVFSSGPYREGCEWHWATLSRY